ncbi:TetR family transcriptional regulator [Nocardioides speluncae]|uniref:TetR family transcriptional regulator n=1 Tax=Nocardioides speluncae TaxID=2670337 RepID=UPI000D69ACE4|nr:TetR family transcriptional regulator [Nocardioides speluncae]
MAYRRTPAIQERLDAQRDTIVAAAIAQLTEEGYAACSIAAVAARAGVATGTVYRHFSSKSELAVLIFRTVVSREVEAVAAAAAAPGTPEERVRAVIETFGGRAIKAPRLSAALLAELVDPAVEAERIAFRRAFRDIFAQPIADGVAAGVLPDQDPQLTAAALIGAGTEALLGPLGTAHPDPATLPHLTAFVLRAIGAPAYANS